MTKFEWEHNLNKYLSELPQIERQKVMDYYRELFDDKFERGETESSIIQSFGNPGEVAFEILRNFDEQGSAAGRAAGGNIPPYSPPFGAASSYTNIPPYPANNTAYHAGYANSGGASAQYTAANGATYTATQSSNTAQATATASNGAAYVPPTYNPYAAAPQGGAAATTVTATAAKKPASVTGTLGAILGVTLNIILIIAAFAMLVTTGSLVFSGAVGAAAGVLSAIVSLFVSMPTAQTLVAFGVSILTAGVMTLLCMLSVKLFKLTLKATKLMFRGTRTLFGTNKPR